MFLLIKGAVTKYTDAYNNSYDIFACYYQGINNLYLDSFGYEEKYGNQFSLEIEMISFITSVGLNSKLILSEDLVKLSDQTDGNITHRSYFNPRFPGMQPISCLFGDLSVADDDYDDASGHDDYDSNPSNDFQGTTSICYLEVTSEKQRCVPFIVPFDVLCIDCGLPNEEYCAYQDLMNVCVFGGTQDLINMYAPASGNTSCMYV